MDIQSRTAPEPNQLLATYSPIPLAEGDDCYCFDLPASQESMRVFLQNIFNSTTLHSLDVSNTWGERLVIGTTKANKALMPSHLKKIVEFVKKNQHNWDKDVQPNTEERYRLELNCAYIEKMVQMHNKSAKLWRSIHYINPFTWTLTVRLSWDISLQEHIKLSPSRIKQSYGINGAVNHATIHHFCTQLFNTFVTAQCPCHQEGCSSERHRCQMTLSSIFKEFSYEDKELQECMKSQPDVPYFSPSQTGSDVTISIQALGLDADKIELSVKHTFSKPKTKSFFGITKMPHFLLINK